jgi:hypothetical protein
MISPRAFLTLAQDLAKLDPRKPRQATLRRAVSTAYYAVFHHLVQEASSAMLGSRREMKEAGTRWFSHSAMATTCNLFVGPAVQGVLANNRSLAGIPVSAALQDVAHSFGDLQQARHEADYDTSSRRFTRQRTWQLVDQAERVFKDWETAASDPWRPVFLLFLLTGDKVAVTR